MRTYYVPGTVLSIVNTEGRNTQLCAEGIYNLVRNTEKLKKKKTSQVTQPLEEVV